MSDLKVIPVEFFGCPADGKRGWMPVDAGEFEVEVHNERDESIGHYLYIRQFGIGCLTNTGHIKLKFKMRTK